MTTSSPVTRCRTSQSGSSLIEFTLVGIGLVFVLISIFEMARGMWIYHTLAHASKEATRFLIVHGAECQTRATCRDTSNRSDLAARIRYHGIGLLPGQLGVQVYLNGTQVIGAGGGFVTLSSLESDSAKWGEPAPRGQSVQVGLRYPFRSALAMLWPGAGKVNFTLTNLGAFSWDTIQF